MPPCAVVEVLGRVQERRQQRERVVGLSLPSGFVVVRAHVVVEHRVAEAVDRVGELGLDGRVDVRAVDVERPDGGLHLASELLEHEVLVLHLGHEAGGLEEALAVPAVGRLGDRQLPLRQRRNAGRGGVSGEHVLDVVDQAVVLGVEDLVDRGERDVLVAATVTADEVRVQHLVVVGAGRLVGEVGRRRVVGVRRRGDRRRAGVVVGVLRARIGVVRDVRQERRVEVRTFAGTATGLARLPSTRPVAVTYCGRPRSGPGMNLPYGSAAIIGMLVTSVSSSCRPSFSAACFLTDAHVPMPSGRPATGSRSGRPAGRRAACRWRRAGWSAFSVVLAQEDLVRGVRRVGLALVDPRRVGVVGVLDVVRRLVDRGRRPGSSSEDAVGAGLVLRPRQHHERLARREPRRRCRRCRPGRA